MARSKEKMIMGAIGDVTAMASVLQNDSKDNLKSIVEFAAGIISFWLITGQYPPTEAERSETESIFQERAKELEIGDSPVIQHLLELLQRTRKITVYGRPLCAPCDALKALFDKAGIPFEYVNIRELAEDERQRVCSEICRVGNLEKAQVPAVAVEMGGETMWFSHGGLEENVPAMFAAIKAHIGLA